MGLIRAGVSAVGSVLADQWKEYIRCDSLDQTVLMARGHRQQSERGSNKKGNDNVITKGSTLVVADGQCMLIVDQGKVVEVCAEAGEYIYDASTEPSVFSGSFGKSLVETFKVMGKRFTYGGETPKDQRVYYINTKELVDNKFGTSTPIPFRVVDQNIGLDIDVAVRCHGVYSYRISDPILFYTNVAGNAAEVVTRDLLDTQLKSEFMMALQPGFAEISAQSVRPSDLPAHTVALSQKMNEALAKSWGELRGLSIVTIALNSVTIPEEDAEMIKNAQRQSIYRNAGMAAAMLTEAQADAMRGAAQNEGGAMLGFMGLGMAQAAGNPQIQQMFQMAEQSKATATAPPVATPAPSAPAWACECGQSNQGKFCSNCGKPSPVSEWFCTECGQKNQGKFCSNCGHPRG